MSGSNHVRVYELRPTNEVGKNGLMVIQQTIKEVPSHNQTTGSAGLVKLGFFSESNKTQEVRTTTSEVSNTSGQSTSIFALANERRKGNVSSTFTEQEKHSKPKIRH